MRIEAYKEQEKKVVRLKLEDNNYDGVDVVATDECGKKLGAGYLLRFNSDGTVRRFTHVGESVGLPLDSAYRVIVD